MDAYGLEFSYLPEEGLTTPEVARRNRMVLYKEHIESGGSAELPDDISENLARRALSLAEMDVDLRSES